MKKLSEAARNEDGSFYCTDCGERIIARGTERWTPYISDQSDKCIDLNYHSLSDEIEFVCACISIDGQKQWDNDFTIDNIDA